MEQFFVAEHRRGRLLSSERTMLRVRWLGTAFALGQVLTFYRPYPNGVTRGFALALTGLLFAGNAALWLSARRARSLRAVRRRAFLALALDIGVIIGLFFIYAFDEGTAIWALLFIVPLEGAIWFRFPGAMAAMAVVGAGYVAREIYAGLTYGFPVLATSITFRIGVGFIIAGVAGGMASNLVKDRNRLAELNERLESEVAEKNRAQEALGRSSDQLVTAQQIAHLGSWEWDIAANVVTWSEELYRLHGVDPQSFSATYEGFLSLVHPEDRAHVSAAVANSFETLEPFEFNQRVVHPTGEIRWIQSTGQVVAGPDGRAAKMVGTGLDITERRRAEDALVHQAGHDPLTGLTNRTLLLDRLTQTLLRRVRAPSPAAVLFLDLDRFKVLNDSLGHAAGDRLLVEVARRLEVTVRPGDTVARFGGDEFIIVCEDMDERGAAGLADRIARAVSVPVEYGSCEITPKVSIGIAVAATSGRETADSMLRDADAAMYRAKERGRDRYEIFEATMRSRADDRLASETALRRAVDRGEIVVHYQPEVDIASGRVLGVEALVRWNHPQRGLVLPEEFVALAEENGLIVSLGETVLRQACAQVAEWHRQRPGYRTLFLSVNLSALQLQAPGLPEMVQRALTEAGLDPGFLCLEITESVLLDDADSHSKALRALRALGVRIVVDDFGTGYSSLTYLKRFPVDLLKIDKSFVEGLGRHAEDRAIVETVIHLAHAFGSTTVAEGVETAEQLEQLHALGCEVGQGYYWSPPLPHDELLIWLDHVSGWQAEATAS